MFSRGQKLVSLSKQTEENERLQELNLPPYELTKGVDLKTVNLKQLREVFGSDATNTKNSLDKPVAYVTPVKKADYTDAQNRAIRNLNSDLNEVSRENFLTRNGQRNQTNESAINEHGYYTRRLNNRYVENASDNDSPPDPYESSGSSYCPDSCDSSNSADVDNNNLIRSGFDLINSDSDEILIQSPIVVKANAVNGNETPEAIKLVTDTKTANNKPETKTTGYETEIFANEIEIEPLLKEISVGEARKLDGKRIRDKGHSCYFCQKIVCNNFSRHIELHHSNEIEAAKILAMPKQSKRRRDAFASLVRYGDFYHNCEVLSLKEGELILARRPNAQEYKFTSYSDYGPCPDCLGFLVKKQLWHHLKYKCPSKTEKHMEYEDQTSGKGPIAESAALLNGILQNNFSIGFLEIIKQFRDDTISKRCKEDDTIMRFGAFLYEKYSCTQSELIRQSMRQLGRLTLEIKKKCVFQNLSEILVPEKFDLIVNATKEICNALREDPTKRPEFQTPSLALKIGYAIKKCASIERGQCLRRGDLKGNRQYLGFLHLLNLEWSVRISSNALSTLHSRKKNAEDLLPITSDLLKLNNFLDSEIKKIKENKSSLNYTKLASLTLARIIMFNKRRSGETAKMTLTDFLSRPNWKDVGTEELKKSLTPLENKLASALTMVKIVGKRGRVVPILLTKDMKESLDLIISKRVQYGILTENPYVFAISNTATSHMRGHDCLKKWCTEAELNSPDLVTSTKLRKYVATVCQIFNLNENECDWLARHLGHDIRVHRQFYRLHENAVELTKVSRLLLAVDQGEVSKFAGKELKDINLGDLEGIDEENAEEKEKDTDTEDHNYSNIVADSLMEDNQSTSNTKVVKKKPNLSKGRKCQKKPWSTEEKEIIFKKFKLLIKRGALPGKEQCTKLLEEHIIFRERKWTDLKFFVKNHLFRLNKVVNKP